MGSAFPLVLIALYFIAVVGVITFVLVLMSRFVSAHQRCASALEQIAHKLPDGANQ
jgi:hypothetical protein